MTILLSMAVGDAYGAGFEYVPAPIVEAENDLCGYRQHQKHLNLKPGCYTDDTQMTLALAEFILSGKGWTHLNLADAFVSTFKRDPRPGYAGGFYKLLLAVQDGTELLRRIVPFSHKNGAAMRAPILGLFKDIPQIFNAALLQATITHATYTGIESSTAAALMLHYFYYDLGDKDSVGEFLQDQGMGEDWDRWSGGFVGGDGYETVTAAIDAIRHNDTMADILKDCVSFTGDVDTVAAIAMACASVSREVEQNLPKVLVDYLENSTYGRDYLIELDAKLMARFPRKTRKPASVPEPEDPGDDLVSILGG